MSPDDDLATALTALARSAPPPVDGRRQVLARLAVRRRRRRAVLLTVVVMLVATAGVVGLRRERSDPQPVVPPDVTPRVAQVYGGYGGVSLSIVVRFPQRTVVTRADVRLQSVSRRASLAPQDGRDLDGPEIKAPLTVAANTRVEVGGGGFVDCGKPAGTPLVTVASRVGRAAETRERYVPANLAAYRKAFATVCRAGLQASVTGSRQNPNGDFSVTLSLVNPGPHPVTVTSEAYDEAGTHWDRASVTVPVASQATLEVSGSGSDVRSGCTHRTPWNTGHLTSNGRPITLPVGGNEQC